MLQPIFNFTTHAIHVSIGAFSPFPPWHHFRIQFFHNLWVLLKCNFRIGTLFMSRIGNDNCSEFLTITLLRRGKQVLLVKSVSTFQCNNIMFTYLWSNFIQKFKTEKRNRNKISNEWIRYQNWINKIKKSKIKLNL